MMIRASRKTVATGALVVLLSGGISVALARDRDVCLTIGRGWCLVRELRVVSLERGQTELVLDRIPDSADLSSLGLYLRRKPLKIARWWREDIERAPLGAPRLERVGDDVVWSPSGDDDEAPLRVDKVHVHLSSPLGGRHVIEVMYLLEGMNWSVAYQVGIRGEQDATSVSCSFRGMVSMDNGTSRTFKDALVYLVKQDEPADTTKPGHGFLELAPDSPLADLWRTTPASPYPEHLYRLPQRVDIPAGRTVDAVLVHAPRAGADWIYVMHSDEVPLSTRGTEFPLHRYLSLRNISRYGLGWALPPGPVAADSGTPGSARWVRAEIPHISVDAPIEIDMGLAERVSARRRIAGKTKPVNGRYDVGYELLLRNRTEQPVTVRIREKPPLKRPWRLLRSSESTTRVGPVLNMDATVPANTTKRVQYKVSVEEPNG